MVQCLGTLSVFDCVCVCTVHIEKCVLWNELLSRGSTLCAVMHVYISFYQYLCVCVWACCVLVCI